MLVSPDLGYMESVEVVRAKALLTVLGWAIALPEPQQQVSTPATRRS